MKPLRLLFAFCLAILPAFAPAGAAPGPEEASVSSIAPSMCGEIEDDPEIPDVFIPEPPDCREIPEAVARARLAATV